MRKFNILLTIILTLALTFFSACGVIPEENTEKSQLTKTEGVLTIGVNLGYAPMEFIDGDSISGFDVDIAEALADKMGLELEMVRCSWDAIFTNMNSGEFDVIISSVSRTREREEQYAFSMPYLDNSIVIMAPSEANISGIEDLSGMSIGVQLDSLADYAVRGFIEDGLDVECAQYENSDDSIAALLREDVQAVCTDSIVANYFMANNDGYEVVWELSESEPICVCMSLNNQELLQQINDALEELMESGVISELSVEYFGVDLTPEQ